MSKSPLKNISLKTFRKYLKWCGLKYIRTKGGHEIWSKEGMERPVVFPTHEDPVYEDIAKNSLRNIGTNVNNFKKFLKSQ